MNRITVKNNFLVNEEIDDNIKVIVNNGLVLNVKIIIEKSTELEITFEALDDKLNIEYEILNKASVNIYEIRTGTKTKVQYQYNICTQAELYLYRFNNIEEIREVDIICLTGENAKLKFNLNTLSQTKEKYDIFVYHDAKNTKSIINNIGISEFGNIIFNVTGVVPKGIKGTSVEQNNRIISFNTKKNQINPNLLIDEYEVEASHSATIGPLDEQEIFYLMSRGIKRLDAIKLLSKGLIISNLNESYDPSKINEYIDMYWR